MRIFLIWLGVVCCGVANGYLFSEFGTPENLVFVFCVSVVCAFLLFAHRQITKDWETPKDLWGDDFHFPVFRLTLFFSVFAMIIFFILRENTEAEIVACATIGFASYVAFRREIHYTDDWI